MIVNWIVTVTKQENKYSILWAKLSRLDLTWDILRQPWHQVAINHKKWQFCGKASVKGEVSDLIVLAEVISVSPPEIENDFDGAVYLKLTFFKKLRWLLIAFNALELKISQFENQLCPSVTRWLKSLLNGGISHKRSSVRIPPLKNYKIYKKVLKKGQNF